MSREDHSLRLFVAAYPPASIIEGAHRLLAQLDLPAHRLTPVEQVHLTLQFIGNISLGELDRITETVESATHGVKVFSLQPRKLVTLPHRGPKRLVAIETDAPAQLIELHRRLAQRLARSARLNPADRFLPHLTLCRFASPTKMPAVELEANFDAWRVDCVQLMRSRLEPAGARHDSVARFELSR